MSWLSQARRIKINEPDSTPVLLHEFSWPFSHPASQPYAYNFKKKNINSKNTFSIDLHNTMFLSKLQLGSHLDNYLPYF